VSLAPDVGVGVLVEVIQSAGNIILKVGWGSITHVVQYLEAHAVVRVVHHLNNAGPELWDVNLDMAWTHLFQSLLTHDRVLVLGKIHQGINVLGVTAQAEGVAGYQVTHGIKSVFLTQKISTDITELKNIAGL
jgi:hypothetical protein